MTDAGPPFRATPAHVHGWIANEDETRYDTACLIKAMLSDDCYAVSAILDSSDTDLRGLAYNLADLAAVFALSQNGDHDGHP